MRSPTNQKAEAPTGVSSQRTETPTGASSTILPLLGIAIAFLAVAFTTAGTALGALLSGDHAGDHAGVDFSSLVGGFAIDAALVVGGETFFGGFCVFLFTKLWQHRRIIRENPKILAVFAVLSLFMNIGFVLTLASIAAGSLPQAFLAICEVVGTAVVTTTRPVVRRGLYGLAVFAVIAVAGVWIYVDPSGGGTAYSLAGVIGSAAVGLGMGARIEYASRLPKEQADFGKQVGSMVAGAVIIVWSLLYDGLPTVPDSVGDITGLPTWAGWLVLVGILAICGVLTTGLPAFCENQATAKGATSNMVAIVMMSAPFVAAPVDKIVHGIPVPWTTFLTGMALVLVGGIGSIVYTKRWTPVTEKVDELVSERSRLDVDAERVAQVLNDLKTALKRRESLLGELGKVRARLEAAEQRLKTAKSQRAMHNALARCEKWRNRRTKIRIELIELNREIRKLERVPWRVLCLRLSDLIACFRRRLAHRGQAKEPQSTVQAEPDAPTVQNTGAESDKPKGRRRKSKLAPATSG